MGEGAAAQSQALALARLRVRTGVCELGWAVKGMSFSCGLTIWDSVALPLTVLVIAAEAFRQPKHQMSADASAVSGMWPAVEQPQCSHYQGPGSLD